LLAVVTRISSCPSSSASPVEPYPPVALADDDAEAIVLDLVQPLAARRQLRGFGWEARRDEPRRQGTLQHAGQIKLCNSDCNQNRAVI
jgi:hypothetical protein